MNFLIHDLPTLVDQYGLWILSVATILLLLGGFGLPLPEDIPLLVMGYLAYRDVLPLWTLIPWGMTLVLGADFIMYYLGRRYGQHVPKLWPLYIYLSPDRLAKASEAFHAHGGKTLFTARFLPGLRSPVFFSAGLFKIPFWKMVIFDGAAAAISVPTIILAAYFCGTQLAKAKRLTDDAKLALFITLLLLALAAVFWRANRRKKQRLASSSSSCSSPNCSCSKTPSSSSPPQPQPHPAPLPKHSIKLTHDH